jgi:hypothetical protein
MWAREDVCELFAQNVNPFAENLGSYTILVIAACHGGTVRLARGNTAGAELTLRARTAGARGRC